MMKKLLSSLVLFSLCLFLLAGCGSTAPASSSTSGTSSTSTPASKDGTSQSVQAGTWLGQNKDTATYYFFDRDSTTGRTASLESGIGVGFSYSMEGETIRFRLGAEDETRTATLTMTDPTHGTLRWENGQEETMTFVSDKGSDTFQFYSNDELCQMAAAYYVRTTGEAAPQAAADLSTETVSIQLYRNLGDHNSTYAWYEVSRFTAKGRDANSGQAIDLTA